MRKKSGRPPRYNNKSGGATLSGFPWPPASGAAIWGHTLSCKGAHLMRSTSLARRRTFATQPHWYAATRRLKCKLSSQIRYNIMHTTDVACRMITVSALREELFFSKYPK